MNRIILAVLALVSTGACARNPATAPRPVPPPAPAAAEQYASLPDTAVCIVDRTTRRGLRSLSARVEPDGQVVVLIAGQLEKLSDLHPIELAAGYAAREPWVTSGEPITVQGRPYEKVGPERRIPLEQVERSDEYRTILVFSDPNDPAPPRALYIPLRPGCVFQAYVRADLLR